MLASVIPSLAGGKVGVDVLHRVAGRTRARPAELLHLDGLGQPQSRDRELGRDEEAVGRHEPQGDDQLNGHSRR
jgi:hypothetical protein